MALNFGPPAMTFEALGSLGKTFFDAQAAAQKRGIDQQSRALLGEAAKSGDYARAGQTLIGLGRVQEGAALLGLAQKEREQKLQEEAYKTSPFSSSAAPRAPSSPSGPTVPLGQPIVAAPRGVQVANSEEDVQRLEAEAAGQTQFGQRSQPRGLRNNNPGNIESGKFAATVQGFQGSDGRFAQYATPEQGIQAADKLLTTYAARGLNTVAGIVNRWAPPTENNTGAYVAQVAKELGVDPNAPLDMSSPEVRQRLIAAKIRVENGRQPYSEDVFQRALNPNWQTEVASFEGGGGNAVAQSPQPSQPLGNGGVYAGVDEATLNGYLNNPRVPSNLKALVQQELASRQGGGVPVRVAQAPTQPGAPVADAPAPGARPVQGFAVPPGQAGKLPENDPFPQVTNEQLIAVIRNPRSAPGDKALAQQLFASRQAYASETAPEKREQTRLETRKKDLEVQKLERELKGEGARPMTPEERAAYSVPDGQPAYMNSKGEPKFGPASTKITNSIGAVEGEYAKANGKAISERFSKIVEEGDAAQQEAGAIARLKELGGSIKNMGAGAALQARLAEYGIKVGENVSEIEAYGAIIDKLTPQQRAPGSGATSDFDAKMFKNSLPGLIRTPQGNALILETMEALNTFKRQRADIVAEAMALNEKPADVMKRLKELPDPFAAFKEARKTAPSMPATPAAPGATAAPSADGWRDLGGGVRIREKR